MASNVLVSAALRAASFVAAPFIIAFLPLLARAETDACTLLSPAQVAAAVGGAMSEGKHVTQSFVRTCTWTPAGTSRIVAVTLNLQTAAFYDGSKRTTAMTVAAAGKGAGITPASVGDDAYYYVAGEQVALFVKKGAASFKVDVYAKIPVADKEAMELKLAKEVVPKL